MPYIEKRWDFLGPPIAKLYPKDKKRIQALRWRVESENVQKCFPLPPRPPSATHLIPTPRTPKCSCIRCNEALQQHLMNCLLLMHATTDTCFYGACTGNRTLSSLAAPLVYITTHGTDSRYNAAIYDAIVHTAQQQLRSELHLRTSYMWCLSWVIRALYHNVSFSVAQQLRNHGGGSRNSKSGRLPKISLCCVFPAESQRLVVICSADPRLLLHW